MPRENDCHFPAEVHSYFDGPYLTDEGKVGDWTLSSANTVHLNGSPTLAEVTMDAVVHHRATSHHFFFAVPCMVCFKTH